MRRIVMILLIGKVLNGQGDLSPLTSPFEYLVPFVPEEAGVMVTPVKLVKGLVLVEGMLEGQRGYFIVDTGAPGLVVNRPPADSVEIRQGHSLWQPLSIGEVVLQELQWGPELLSDVPALSLDLKHLEAYSEETILGLLGYQLLRDYLVFIDYRKEEAYWVKNQNGTVLNPKGRAFTCGFELLDHLPVITLTVDSIQLRFVIDTGSSVNLISDQAAMRITETGGLTGNGPITLLEGLERSSELLPTLIIPRLLLGEIVQRDQAFNVTNLQPVSEFVGSRIDGILGYHFLKDRRLILDYHQQKLTILD